uniref:NADH-ubiquinone oxidoreductase chain 3 n=1 Tax=Nesodiprion zhejiangensis TaxID=2916818 RepID=A0A9E7VAY0_9HYME|nr:NADH dehydrogenase subunit 3 [Nesodiprion zhejiangensis]UZC33520.1 NADH dehydrogenase subunit 3 [Nesodiprion zhejiangensis]
MKLMIYISLMIMTITILMMLISLILSKKTIYESEKNSPFECGFDPKGNPRMSFSIRFFLIAVIFLIFDVEVTLMLPMILILPISNMKIWLFMTLFFIMILLIGLYYEWKFGALNWI